MQVHVPLAASAGGLKGGAVSCHLGVQAMPWEHMSDPLKQEGAAFAWFVRLQL